jgi:glycolate oxidase FAD binding subunit
MGGKVVKNAAGFDLPKFFVGSLGRFGVLAEMTFKVFPRAPSTRTLKIETDGIDASVKVVTEAARTRWETDALEILPGGKTVLLRLAAPEAALDAIAGEVLARWSGKVMNADEAAKIWTDIGEFRWADETLVKVPLTPDRVPALCQALPEHARVHISGGGNVAYVSLPEAVGASHDPRSDGVPPSDRQSRNVAPMPEFAKPGVPEMTAGRRHSLDRGSCNAVDDMATSFDFRGLTLRGAGPLWLGASKRPNIHQAVKDALDPQHRFPD